MNLQTHSDETLMRRLQNYDEKYYFAVMTPRQNEWKIRDKAERVAQELTNRGVFFSAVHLKINNY